MGALLPVFSSVISLESSMSKAVHPQEFSKVDIEH